MPSEPVSLSSPSQQDVSLIIYVLTGWLREELLSGLPWNSRHPPERNLTELLMLCMSCNHRSHVISMLESLPACFSLKFRLQQACRIMHHLAAKETERYLTEHLTELPDWTQGGRNLGLPL